MANLIEWVGLLAAFCTTCAFVPQVLQVIKSKDTSSISLHMYLVFLTGIVLWLIYGIYLNNLPMMLANSVTLLLAGTVLCLKIKYK